MRITRGTIYSISNRKNLINYKPRQRLEEITFKSKEIVISLFFKKKLTFTYMTSQDYRANYPSQLPREERYQMSSADQKRNLEKPKLS